MKLLVSGSTGLIGTALVQRLASAGHDIVRLVRGRAEDTTGAISWASMTAADLEDLNWVVHLAGENIAGRRWSAAQKARIRASRVEGTRRLCRTLAQVARPPQVLVCASAVGYYGDRGDEVLREDSAPGTGFLPEVCREWEAAAEPALEKGIRVVHLRFGLVLSPAGGALGKMLLPFKLGVGGRIGNGRQYMSWISLDDVVGATGHALTTEVLRGPVNVVAPNPVTNAEFTRVLGRLLRRPTLFPVPAFGARLALGEMAEALLLSSTRVEPGRLLETGYQFLHVDLEAALRYLLGR